MPQLDELFIEMQTCFEEIEFEYNNFKRSKSIASRKRLLEAIKTFNYPKNLFTRKLKDLLLSK